jgi:glycosyltransferase involved in cell wall biosynthesis
MRILHLVKTAQGATWARRQVAVLCASGVDAVVALPGGSRTPQGALWKQTGATVVDADLDVTARRPWRLAEAVRRCRALVDAVAPDLIHSHFVSTTLVARLALGRRHPIPRLFQVAGPLHLEHRTFRTLDLATAGPRDGWIATCRWTADAYRRFGVPASRVWCSYYGTDLTPFDGAPRGRFRGDLGVTPMTPLVGLVAYMYPPRWYLGQRVGLKGHEDFIEAIRRVRGLRRGVVGVIVGGPWGGPRNGADAYAAQLRHLAGTACGTGIRFAGVRDDVPAVYRDLDVAVHPSHSENCGGAVESLAAGCPTVATTVGGLPDVVEPGRTGWLVPPRDPDALAAAILTVLADPLEARRRARTGQEHVHALFDVERTAREVLGIYRQVLDPAPAAAPRLAAGAHA